MKPDHRLPVGAPARHGSRGRLPAITPARHRSRGRLPAIAAAVAISFAAGVLPALGIARPARVLAGPGPQVWLDRPAPAASDEPGTQVAVGFSLWDPAGRGFMGGTFPFVRLRPATGDAPPIRVSAVEDWKGHYQARLEVPAGGAGLLDVGMSGTACDSNGCQAADALFPIAGVGPPPEAPLPAIATASIALPPDAVAAGEPVAIGITVIPNTDWDPAGVPFPDALVLDAGIVRGVALEPVPAPLMDRGRGTYRASVTFPDAGDYTLAVATRAGATAQERFATSLVTLTVDAARGPSGPAAGAGLDPLVAGGLVVVVVILGAVILAGVWTRRRA